MNRQSKRAWGTASLSAIAMTLALASSVGWAGLANCLEPVQSEIMADSAASGGAGDAQSVATDAAADGNQSGSQSVGTPRPAKSFSWKNLLPGSPW